LNSFFFQISVLPADVSAAKKLAFLNLQNNILSQLPPQLSMVTSFRVLNLGFNGFKEIPSCIFQLQQLEVLLLTNNEVFVFAFFSFRCFPLSHPLFLIAHSPRRGRTGKPRSPEHFGCVQQLPGAVTTKAGANDNSSQLASAWKSVSGPPAGCH